MDDAVQISEQAFRNVYEDSFTSWYRTYEAAIRNPDLELLAPYLWLDTAFRHFPPLLNGLRIQHSLDRIHNQAYATGITTWYSTRACAHGFEPFVLHPRFEIGTRHPFPLRGSWFARGDQNYISVLILAWSYLLSNRWCELMGQPHSRRRPWGWEAMHQRPCCTLRYLGCRAPEDVKETPGAPRGVTVDIGDASAKEARWWAAILAPGRGWQAGMTLGEDSTFWSPWSFRLQAGPRFTISLQEKPPRQPVLLQQRKPRSRSRRLESAPTFSEALGYLNNFCVRHGILDQSHAALAAVLLLPAMKDLVSEIKLPAVVVNNQPPPPVSWVPALSSAEPRWPLASCEHLDELMAVSCYSAGIIPMLLNVFYNPEIKSNAVTPWLQGALAVIKTHAANAPLVVCRMLMERQPGVAFLWFGVTVLGLQEWLLHHARLGWIPIDLVSAGWSRTLQSFVQQPVSTPLDVNEEISRADQGRLLFMSTSPKYQSAPSCPWKPFGENPGVETDMHVQHHGQCNGHELQCRSFQWDTDRGKLMFWTGDLADCSYAIPGRALLDDAAVPTQVPVDYRGMRREDELASQVATRSIFDWLRMHGNTPGESAIWRHKWFRNDDDSDDDWTVLKSDSGDDENGDGWGEMPKLGEYGPSTGNGGS
ncbi:hypothetical protein N657DRAFT_662338 [Parathielavia appendiculata]|uniref:Uncharacterized protein n=1 Tax=Parathielavia appendiculata TaxID=2587402 RepID=A0AAN6U3Y1_9PEZI|nr:hypothetical protein N657DRAFT_662338 [Parathielavia appendiculata]